MEKLLGCIFSDYDSRDYTLKCASGALPEAFECKMNIPVKSQGSVCSCVAHACSSILEYHANPFRQLSTNFIYGLQKELFNREGKGMMLRDACKIVTDYGSPEVHLCPGNTEVPDCYKVASNALNTEVVVKNAWQYRTLKYFRCETVTEIKHAIRTYGPVLIAYKWYDDFKVENGVLTGPRQEYSGGHALVAYGWNKDGFLIQNSWGKDWGNSGKCLIPYEIKFREAFGIVDATLEDLGEFNIPVKNSLTNLAYKALNFIVNLFRKLFKID